MNLMSRMRFSTHLVCMVWKFEGRLGCLNVVGHDHRVCALDPLRELFKRRFSFSKSHGIPQANSKVNIHRDAKVVGHVCSLLDRCREKS